MTEKNTIHYEPDESGEQEKVAWTVRKVRGKKHRFVCSTSDKPYETELWLQARIYPVGTEIRVIFP